MSGEENNYAEEKFRFVFETIAAADVMTEPLTGSIEQLLRISAAEMNSSEASVIIRDGGEGDLRFLSAIGKVASQLKDLKIPAGKGIAGFVFSSGQPIALTDVGEEASFYAEVDKKTGFQTQTILATPIRYKGDVIGVLEYLNRSGESNYTPAEMDKAALFAEAIGSLVNAYEASRIFKGLTNKILTGEEKIKLDEVRDWLANLEETVQHREMIDLAVMIREIAGRGDAERRLCIEIFQSILGYANRDAETGFLNY